MTNWWLVLVVVPLVQSAHVAKLNMVQSEGNYSQQTTFWFNQTTEHVLVFPTSDSIYPYRIKAWSTNAKIKTPVLVVVRQEREVLSWQIPFVVDSSNKQDVVHFHNTSRTLCHNHMPEITKTSKLDFDKIRLIVLLDTHSRLMMKDLSQNFIVALSTSSAINIDITIVVEEEKNFYLTEAQEYSVSVSPSEPKYYYYKFFNDTKSTSAIIEIVSDDDICLTVSIQDSYVRTHLFKIVL